MDAPFPPSPSNPDTDSDERVNQISLMRNGHTFVFRYDADDAFEMICVIMSMADDKANGLNWQDVLEITECITSQAIDDGIVV